MRSPPPLELELPAKVDAVPEARHKLARWLTQSRVDLTVTDELKLVITELVTNAVEATERPDGSIGINAHFDSGPVVVITVTDEGSGFELSNDPKLPDRASVRGRGLPIVHALMDDLAVRRLNGHTEVEVVRKLRADNR